MNSRISFQQLKGLLFVKGLFALLLAAPNGAYAADTATLDDIKDTNYLPPTGAYFVSPDGNHTNSGRSVASSWSVEKAIASAPSGATIVLRGGTYRNVNTYINKRLTLQAYPHEKPLLKGSIEVQGWVADGGKWRKDGWNYSFPPNVGREFIDRKLNPMAGHRDMVYINGEALKQVGSKAAVGPGKFYVDYANNKLYIGNNPAGKTVEATTQTGAFKISNASGTVVRGLGFAHYADQALFVGAPHVTIENNTFVWNGQQGVKFWAQNDINTDNIVRGNRFSYNGRQGLGGSRAHRLLIVGNTISNNNVERFAKTWDAAGIKLTRSNGLILRDNLVENNNAAGIWLDVSNTNATVVRNVVRNHEWMGIWFELSHKAIIAANVVYNNAVGIYILDASSARVYNNTLSKNGMDFRMMDGRRQNPDAKQRAAGITWNTRDTVVKNNIFSHNNSGGTIFQGSSCSTQLGSRSLVAAVNYNAYYRKSSSNPRNIINWSHGRGRCPTAYTSIAAFKAATGLEQNALAIDNVATNPFFVDEARGNYQLKPGSPAINRGEPLPGDIARAIGVASGRQVNLGAHQKIVLRQ